MLVVILGLISLMILGVGLFYQISYLISIISNPLITLTLLDYLVWFTTCITIGLIIFIIIIIYDELEYMIWW